MEVRRMDESDRDRLREIYLISRTATFPDSETPTYQLQDFDVDTGGEAVWVACQGDVPVGFASVWEKENYVHNLFLHPDHIRKGLGRALLNAVLDQIGRPARLKCQARNRSAYAFYISLGWKVIAEGEGKEGPYFLMELKA